MRRRRAVLPDVAGVAGQPPGVGLVFIVLAPFLYALVGFIFTFILAWVYNLVARFLGGIEYTTTETRDF